MELDILWQVAERARSQRRLDSEDVAFVRDVVPVELQPFPGLKLPKTIRHPAGFPVSGAPVGTLLSSALLMVGQKALGKRYGGSPFYEKVERELAFGIMRSHFHHGYPKGAHCCAQCTLAVYPVLEAGSIRYFDCDELAKDVRRLIQEGGWRFSSPVNPKLKRWALGPIANGAKLHGDRSAPISALVYRIALDVSVSVVACRASSAASALLVQ